MLNELHVGVWAPRIRENNVKGAKRWIWRENYYVSCEVVTKHSEIRTLLPLILLAFCGMIVLHNM